MNNGQEGCQCSSGCCVPPTTGKKVHIEFLYLDLIECERCRGTDHNLDAAVSMVAPVLAAAGYETVVDKINIVSAELAVQHMFVSSPTIRVNGRDIAMEVTETLCGDCGDLCGSETECRSWIYEGAEYDEPPTGMIISAILRGVFGGGPAAPAAEEPYVLPENLAKFFAGVATKR